MKVLHGAQIKSLTCETDVGKNPLLGLGVPYGALKRVPSLVFIWYSYYIDGIAIILIIISRSARVVNCFGPFSLLV